MGGETSEFFARKFIPRIRIKRESPPLFGVYHFHIGSLGTIPVDPDIHRIRKT